MPQEGGTLAVGAWTECYEITSMRGRVWSRAMIRSAALALGRRLGLPVDGARVDAVLDDERFMASRRGMIPARVVDDIHTEARIR